MELIVAALAWPAVVLLLAIIVLVMFRRPIASLLDRTKKVGKGGIETFEGQPAQPTEERKGIEEFLRRFDSPLLVEAERLILNDLKERKIEDAPDRERALLRSLASTNIILHFERVHGLMWASQLACLRYLNTIDHGAEQKELAPIYEHAKSEYPAWYENQTFERWLAFLRAYNLITEREERLVITVAGREFLKYLVAAGKGGPYVA